jgi:ABC-type phosphate/phosphonate transport system ATPase subunit
MLILDRVGKTYPNGVHALENFSARIQPGEIVAIIGRLRLRKIDVAANDLRT